MQVTKQIKRRDSQAALVGDGVVPMTDEERQISAEVREKEHKLKKRSSIVIKDLPE